MKKLFFFELLKPWKSHIVSTLSFLLCNENLNRFFTRVRKLFKGGNYSKEETIRGNTVCIKMESIGSTGCQCLVFITMYLRTINLKYRKTLFNNTCKISIHYNVQHNLRFNWRYMTFLNVQLFQSYEFRNWPWLSCQEFKNPSWNPCDRDYKVLITCP